jgi:hypothetical protein
MDNGALMATSPEKKRKMRGHAYAEWPSGPVNGAWEGRAQKPVKNFRRSLENVGERLRAVGEQAAGGEPFIQKTGCRAFAAQAPERMPRGRRRNQKPNLEIYIP